MRNYNSTHRAKSLAIRSTGEAEVLAECLLMSGLLSFALWHNTGVDVTSAVYMNANLVAFLIQDVPFTNNEEEI